MKKKKNRHPLLIRISISYHLGVLDAGWPRFHPRWRFNSRRGAEIKKSSLCVPVNQSFVRAVRLSAPALTRVRLFDLGFSKKVVRGWPLEIISFPSRRSSATPTGHPHTWLYGGNPLFTATALRKRKKSIVR